MRRAQKGGKNDHGEAGACLAEAAGDEGSPVKALKTPIAKSQGLRPAGLDVQPASRETADVIAGNSRDCDAAIACTRSLLTSSKRIPVGELHLDGIDVDVGDRCGVQHEAVAPDTPHRPAGVVVLVCRLPSMSPSK